jgi:phage antirepressor YoqD-like protein
MQLIKSESFGTVMCDLWKDDKGDIWFTREQIGQALEYSFPQEAIQKIHERNSDRLDKFSVQVKLTSTDGKVYNTTVYSQKGLNEICRFSRQPKADAFMDWVWEVVESIRRYGLYATEELLNDPDLAIKAFTALKEERERNKLLSSKIELDKPKVEYFDTLVERNLLTNFRDTAKEFKMKERAFIEWLINKGYIYRDSKKNIKPYAQYVPSLFQIKEFATPLHAGNQTLITPKGRETFRLLLSQLSA